MATVTRAIVRAAQPEKGKTVNSNLNEFNRSETGNVMALLAKGVISPIFADFADGINGTTTGSNGDPLTGLTWPTVPNSGGWFDMPNVTGISTQPNIPHEPIAWTPGLEVALFDKKESPKLLEPELFPLNVKRKIRLE